MAEIVSIEACSRCAPLIAELRAHLAEQREQIARLEADVRALQERVRQNSSNSHLPPSSNRPGNAPPKKTREPGERKRGAQDGHPGKARELLPVEEVDKVVECRPRHCRDCGGELEGTDPSPRRHQVTEIPPIRPEVTEYQLHTLCCSQCLTKTQAPLPPGVGEGAFGPRLTAIVSIASGSYQLSKRKIELMVSDFFGAKVSLGSIVRLQRSTSRALEPCVEQAKTYVRAQEMANMDETPWPERYQTPSADAQEVVMEESPGPAGQASGTEPCPAACPAAMTQSPGQQGPGTTIDTDLPAQESCTPSAPGVQMQQLPATPSTEAQAKSASPKSKSWLWVMVSGAVAIFAVNAHRSTLAAQALLGTFKGVLGTDRLKSYNFIDLLRHQFCWAHLKRDFRKIQDRGGVSEPIGKDLLLWHKRLFEHLRRAREGDIAWSTFKNYASTVRWNIKLLLRKGTECADPKTVGTCRELLANEPAMWTFVRVQGMEPTNNIAEQALRQAVLWRKISFGTQSREGSIFVERMLTVVHSLRLQKRNVLEFVTEACTAALHNRPAPSLLPLVQSPQELKSTG